MHAFGKEWGEEQSPVALLMKPHKEMKKTHQPQLYECNVLSKIAKNSCPLCHKNLMLQQYDMYVELYQIP